MPTLATGTVGMAGMVVRLSEGGENRWGGGGEGWNRAGGLFHRHGDLIKRTELVGLGRGTGTSGPDPAATRAKPSSPPLLCPWARRFPLGTFGHRQPVALQNAPPGKTDSLT